MLQQIVVVLHRPQNIVNIGGAVRAMRNMGLERLRMVAPPMLERADLLGIAHRCEAILDAAETFATLDAALADAIYVAGTTSRPRAATARVLTPRAAAPELLARATSGPVALVFGPEDNGLSNEDLDRCHAALVIPAEPEYPSLNLAQAVLLTAYELRLAAGTPAPARHPTPYPPATAEQLEGVFAAAEQMLWGVEFFKSGQAEGMLRTLRSLVHRAEPDTREARLLQAICLETLKFVQRKTSG
jgi:TrmH family RNA methyltransferase